MLDTDELREFQFAQDTLEQKSNELSTKQQEFRTQNRELIDAIRELSDAQEVARTSIKAKAVEEFEAIGDKQLIGGLGIRCVTILKYESGSALYWAKEHDLCLSLDKSEFNKIAKTQDLDFVTKDTKIIVTFPPKIKFTNK